MFLSYFLMHWGISVILTKYNSKKLLMKVSEKIEVRFLYEMSECEFCMNHHSGILPLVPFMIYYGFEWEWLLIPFMSASLMNIIKTIR